MTNNYLRKICESGELNLARRWDRISLQVFVGSFVLVNGALIAVAIIHRLTQSAAPSNACSYAPLTQPRSGNDLTPFSVPVTMRV
jgi:hypothetical protein